MSKLSKGIGKNLPYEPPPIIAIVDTNVNPEPIDYPIPANDDSPETVEYIIKNLLSVITKK